jgi:WD40 repeat protein
MLFRSAFPQTAVTVAYVAQTEGGARLFVRPIDSVTARPLAGTEDAFDAFWSPDSRYIGVQSGFGPNSTLTRVEASGGSPLRLGRCGVGTWSREGVIICEDGEGGLSRVPAAGGALTKVTTPDTALQETWHRFPYFLPDGRHYLYLAWSTKPENRAVYVGALDTDRKTRLLTVESKVVYASPGFLLFHRRGTLFAQAFDTTRQVLQGEPVRLANDIVWATNGAGAFAASSTGTLVYRSSTIGQLAWFDRQGRHLENIGPARPLGNVVLSPDEKKVALMDPSQGELLILEISTGIVSRLTTDPAGKGEPVWSPDSRTVAFASLRTGTMAVFQRTLGSREDVPVFESAEGHQWPDDWSRDGKFILINDRNAGIVDLPTTGDRKPIRLLLSPSAVIDEAHFSPDAQWVAYVSTESGQAEIHVASFPEFQITKQVSAGGGNAPQWRGDGKELFYMTGDGQIMAVGVSATGLTLNTTAPKKLFATGVSTGTPGGNHYAVSFDGNRFLVPTSAQDSRPTPITVMLNWTSTLKRQVND